MDFSNFEFAEDETPNNLSKDEPRWEQRKIKKEESADDLIQKKVEEKPGKGGKGIQKEPSEGKLKE